MQKFVVNGKTYASLDEVPPDIRQTFEQTLGLLRDGNRNGLPDILEGKTGANVSTYETTVNLPATMQIITGGKTYTNINDMPADVRIKYDQAMAKFGPLMSGANGNGTLDVFEGKQPATAKSSKPENHSEGMGIPSGLPQNPPTSVITEVKPFYSAKAFILLVGLVLVILVGVGAYLMIPYIK